MICVRILHHSRAQIRPGPQGESNNKLHRIRKNLARFLICLRSPDQNPYSKTLCFSDNPKFREPLRKILQNAEPEAGNMPQKRRARIVMVIPVRRRGCFGSSVSMLLVPLLVGISSDWFEAMTSESHGEEMNLVFWKQKLFASLLLSRTTDLLDETYVRLITQGPHQN
ncbi:uncharacterized protein LOC110661098 [Hevea brasiliensis]|uniref:uncharacterized protein LOC110661098 n=1 Tax=Hevea brasiliensis TaxID=3981 RepID=UPI0025EE0800|nr:uncharacterized protein LOC110661098 [Hevea brasiliensis]